MRSVNGTLLGNQDNTGAEHQDGADDIEQCGTNATSAGQFNALVVLNSLFIENSRPNAGILVDNDNSIDGEGIGCEGNALHLAFALDGDIHHFGFGFQNSTR